ncbi:hypothetical protein K505DRAFT_330190 [Melanomma pulvis-pyrius CBS 109.77]|uniref:Uncharacterized protein n=1 Tax=Melanomma pulvis-pyrius CBS 109.77 TaxID=1314802 RepID=A0A6A6WS96_9PLEO|nr:hypothetical protein K505DRAFT_330190 [Melanomma pulvis-pyrius CBS 109.77]
MAVELTYLLSPKFYFKRDGPIALGSIVVDPFRPHVVLTAVDAATLTERYPKVETFTDFDQNLTSSQGTNVSVAAWLEFLHTASAKIGLAREKHRLDQYTMTSLETEYFLQLPGEEVIKSRVKVDRVRETMKASGLLGARQPVYMVTGRKLAKGFSAIHESGKQMSGDAEAGGSAPTPAGNIAVKSGAAGHKERELQTGWKAGDELVFAYQLMKIDIKGWRNSKVEYDEFRHESALLSNDDDDGDEEEDDDDVDIEVDISVVTAEDLAKATDEGAMTEVEVGEGVGKLMLVSTSDS